MVQVIAFTAMPVLYCGQELVEANWSEKKTRYKTSSEVQPDFSDPLQDFRSDFRSGDGVSGERSLNLGAANSEFPVSNPGLSESGLLPKNIIDDEEKLFRIPVIKIICHDTKNKIQDRVLPAAGFPRSRDAPEQTLPSHVARGMSFADLKPNTAVVLSQAKQRSQSSGNSRQAKGAAVLQPWWLIPSAHTPLACPWVFTRLESEFLHARAGPGSCHKQRLESQVMSPDDVVINSFICRQYLKSFYLECKLDQIVSVNGDVQFPLEDYEARAAPRTV
ncbi:hypothetical protein DV515_00013433 [Chloebia gouldiae]|uniref:Uncharacterized protein n=1 Tax=Chloebia gouldiae TaxID=44316 RepID=A0A3L8S114_CHLGU|nr:hypothetical protein DV515_00013433 [Chloebia gouldiae]